MNPRVKSVMPNKDFSLTIEFANDEIKTFDMKPYLDIGVFKTLKDWNRFCLVNPFLGSIQWEDGQDLCPDTLYLESNSVVSGVSN